MTNIAILLLSLTGFIFLLLAMARHQQDWFGRKLAPAISRALRLCGFTTLVLALVTAVAGLGWGYGSVAWFGWLTMAAGLVVALNINRQRILRKGRP